MKTDSKTPNRYVEAIRSSGLAIYDPVAIDDPELWIPTLELGKLLHTKLAGISLAGLPLRTRSKVVKEHVCRALGYPAPQRFKKTKPRFPGQFLDIYIQKSNNLQIWNEEIEPRRRYAIFRVGKNDVIAGVRAVEGSALAQLDTTGTLTQKYQARVIPGEAKSELIVDEDTDVLLPFVWAKVNFKPTETPTDYPRKRHLLPIKKIFKRLRVLIGESFPDMGHDQERNRGAALHRLVCRRLGYADYRDDGQFPDVRHQLLEVKLQTSPTIDLGLVCPDSKADLDAPKIDGRAIRHCDVRYALFYAVTDGRIVTLTNFFLTTGEKFFTRFPQFQGRILNRKIQIPLPVDFFRVQAE